MDRILQLCLINGVFFRREIDILRFMERGKQVQNGWKEQNTGGNSICMLAVDLSEFNDV